MAVGVILNSEKQILIALRSEHVHQGGLWEFPGGKVEAGENVQQALARELSEELGIAVVTAKPLLEVQHDYREKSVLLDVWWVESFSGKPTGREGQPVRWVSAEQLSSYSFPEANKMIVSTVQKALATQTFSSPSIAT